MKPITRKVWRYAHADWEKAEELLNCIEWDFLLSTDVNVHVCWSTWKNCFVQVMELCIPHSIARVRKNAPWINKQILNAIKKSDILFRTAKLSGKLSDHTKYNVKRNQLVSMIRENKQSFQFKAE